MQDIQEQLADLRRRMARVDRKYAAPAVAAESPERVPGASWIHRPGLPQRPARRPEAPGRIFIENLMSGEVVQTACGQHSETARLWERHRRHGRLAFSDPAEL